MKKFNLAAFTLLLVGLFVVTVKAMTTITVDYVNDGLYLHHSKESSNSSSISENYQTTTKLTNRTRAINGKMQVTISRKNILGVYDAQTRQFFDTLDQDYMYANYTATKSGTYKMWVAYADFYGGNFQGTPMRGIVELY